MSLVVATVTVTVIWHQRSCVCKSVQWK